MSATIQLPSQAALRRHAREYAAILDSVIAQGVPQLTAFVVAGDLQSARRVDEFVAAGERPKDLVWRVGSYARFEWAIKNLSRRELFAILPELWIASDPDDTKFEYLALWKAARVAKGRLITDGQPLPRKSLTIYRGQIGNVIGISWTLDKAIAEKFSRTGGGRGLISGGKILTRKITSRDVIAYLTGRGESEIIFDPCC